MRLGVRFPNAAGGSNLKCRFHRELCRRAGIRYGVVRGFPPLLVLRDRGGHASGKTDARNLVYVDTRGC